MEENIALTDDSLTLSERYACILKRCSKSRPMCPVLITQRFRLRMLRPDDLELLTALDTDERVMQYIHGGAMSARRARLYAETFIETAPLRIHLHRWIIERPDQSLRIGWMELSKYEQEPKRDLSDDIQLSYEISPENWGQGFATEAGQSVLDHAFGKLELDRVVAYARPENVRSLRVLKKLGFLRDGACTDGAGNVCRFYFLPCKRWRGRQDRLSKRNVPDSRGDRG